MSHFLPAAVDIRFHREPFHALAESDMFLRKKAIEQRRLLKIDGKRCRFDAVIGRPIGVLIVVESILRAELFGATSGIGSLRFRVSG